MKAKNSKKKVRSIFSIKNSLILLALAIGGILALGFRSYQLDKFSSITPTPTEAPTPTPQPSSTPTETNNTYADRDPVINCKIHANCGGGTRLLKRSVCDNSTCCQIKNSWIFYENSNKCDQDQSSLNNRNQQSGVQKIPVVLPHNGLTYYCDPSVAQSIKDASNAVKASTSQYSDCLKNQQNNANNCSSSCPTVNICSDEMVRTSYGYSSYDDCLAKRQQEGLDCINKCYNGDLAKLGQQVCNIGSSNASDSLNELLNRYCR